MSRAVLFAASSRSVVAIGGRCRLPIRESGHTLYVAPPLLGRLPMSCSPRWLVSACYQILAEYIACGGDVCSWPIHQKLYPRVCFPSVSKPHLVAMSPCARGSSRILSVCEQWYFGEIFIRFCVKDQMVAGPRAKGCQLRQGDRIGRFTRRLYNAAVRSGAHSRAPAFS